MEITDAAIAWIRSNRRRHRIPEKFGLRVFRHDGGGLATRSSAEPDMGEETVLHGGLRFFVSADAARALAGRRIDVRASGESDGLVLTRSQPERATEARRITGTARPGSRIPAASRSRS
jgi:hypothetical protein